MIQLTEVLTIQIQITGMDEVKGKQGTVRMIHFEGDCDCKNFHGKVLPGGVDTQKERYGENTWLSARYMLEGIDGTGEKCRIFIENNGTVEEDGKITTHPILYTDSVALERLETADLTGSVEGTDGGVCIHIFLSEEKKR